MPLKFDDLRTGYAALWSGLITEEDLRSSLARQGDTTRRSHLRCTMAQLLLRDRLLTKYQLGAVEKAARGASADEFVELVRRNGYVTMQVIDECRGSDGDGAEAESVANRLLANGYVTVEQAADILKSQCRSEAKELAKGPRSLGVIWRLGDDESEKLDVSLPDDPRKGLLRGQQETYWKPLAGVFALIGLVVVFMVVASRWGTDDESAHDLPLQTSGTTIELPEESEKLVAALTDKRVRVRDAALKGLVLKKEKATQALTDALMTHEAKVKRGAIHALGLTKDEGAVPHLATVLDDEDWANRYHAVEALGKIGGRAAYKAIAKMLTDREEVHPQVRSRAAWRLGYSGDKSYVPLLKKLAKDLDHEVARHASNAVKQLTASGGPSKSAK